MRISSRDLFRRMRFFINLVKHITRATSDEFGEILSRFLFKRSEMFLAAAADDDVTLSRFLL